MRHIKARSFHVSQQFFRWRGGCGKKLHGLVEPAFFGLGSRDHQRHDNGRAAQVGDALISQSGPDRLCPHLTQTDMSPDDRRQCPRETPTIAVKHRQRPQIDRMLRHRRRQRIALRQKICASVVRHDTFWIARGPRSVIDRNRVPFVQRHQPVKFRIACRQEGLVILRVCRNCSPTEFSVVVLDDQWCHCGQRQRVLHQ